MTGPLIREHVPVLLAACAMFCGATSNAAQFVPLGDLFGGLVSSSASAVTDGGNLVVGNSKSFRSVNLNEAYTWTPARGMLPLGDLTGGVFASSAFDVSADGTTVVGVGTAATGNAAIALTAAGIVNLGDLPGGNVSSAARGISADGSVIVGSSSSDLGTEAFRWTGEGGMVGLSDLVGGRFFSSAAAISADNQVIVGASASAAGDEAFRWTTAEGMTGLGDLPGGAFSSEATAVSYEGSIIVGNSMTESGPQAFRWTPAVGMLGLGWLSDASTWSEAQSVSADGSVVVGFSGIGEAQQAFLWTVENGLEGLQDVLETRFELADALSGWRLTSANDVSPDGRYIVGTGVNPNGDSEAWLVRLADLLPGDYNASGQVEQADLDLVLLNWGAAGYPAPSGWLADLPIGAVDQGELDAVLIHWGSRLATATASSTTVPEPHAWLVVAICWGAFVCNLRHLPTKKALPHRTGAATPRRIG